LIQAITLFHPAVSSVVHRCWRYGWVSTTRIKTHTAPDKSEKSIESRDLKGGQPALILSDPRLEEFCWLHDGRVIYARAELPPNEKDNNFWQIRVDTRTGEPADRPRTPQLSFGVIGGAALTDAFGHYTTGFIIEPNGIEPTLSRSYSTLKDYAIGPMVEVGLPWRGLSVEIDGLYRPMNLTLAGVLPDGSLNSISPATVVTWELPAFVKYRFGSRPLKPFIEAGPEITIGNLVVDSTK